MDNINSRIEQIKILYFGEERGNHKKFCDTVGVASNTASNWMKDGYPIGMSVTSQIMEAFPSINSEWLLTGEGNPYKKDGVDNSTLPKKEIEENHGFITYLLPMSAMGGSLTGFAEQGVMLQNCEAIVSPIENVDFAITVYGESMSPEYPSGSRILIKKINPDIFIDWGKAFVLDTPNGVIVKEIHESSEEGFISCHSINTDPKFKPFNVPANEIFGMYRVLMCLSAK